MCGRFPGPNKVKLLIALGVLPAEAWRAEWDRWEPNHNVAPTQRSPIVVAGAAPRTLEFAQWGWRPPWMKSGVLVNAKSETAGEKPMFRVALRERRCVVPAAGFFEWKTQGKAKLPYWFRLRGEDIVAIGALYSDEKEAGEPRRRFLLLTTAANELVAPVHDRMAVLLDRAGVDAWLDPAASSATLGALCQPFDASRMEAVAVSPLLNSVKNTGPEVLEPPTAAGDVA